MLKQIFAIGLFVAGSAGMTALAYLQTHPRAFTSAREQSVVKVAAEPSPIVRTLPEPVSIEPQQPPATPPVAPKAHKRRVRDAPLTPCSSFRTLGPSRVESGTAEGSHAVRKLCSP